MALFTDIDAQVAVLRDLFGGDVAVSELATQMSSFSGEKLVDAMAAAATLARSAERIGIVGAGIVASRSRREVGQDGLAQGRGHRSPAALIQEITGASHADAQRQVRLGQSILDSEAAGGDAAGGPWPNAGVGAETSGTDPGGAGASAGDSGPGATAGEAGPDAAAAQPGFGDGRPRAPWHAPLSTALLQGRISPAQQDAIQRGLGHPIDDAVDTHAAWSAAAEQLIEEAGSRTVEELRVQARQFRDQLDPEGAERRFAERYERRAFRIWTDADGVEHGRIEFEDDGAAWMRTIRDAALRPRRGGPRFVDSGEARQAADLTADSRTNDQLGYDLLIDLLRAGALADATTVFGTRQAGVRIVTVVDDAGASVSARTEDYGHPLAPSAVDKRICDTGAVQVNVDSSGNPLDVGREHRLFTPRLLLRSPPHRRMGTRPWPHRHRSRDPALPPPPYAAPPSRLADRPAGHRRLHPAPTRRQRTHPAETPRRPHRGLGRHRPTTQTLHTHRSLKGITHRHPSRHPSRHVEPSRRAIASSHRTMVTTMSTRRPRPRILAATAAMGAALWLWAECVEWRASRRWLGRPSSSASKTSTTSSASDVVVVLGYRNGGERANLVNRFRVRAGIRSLDPTAVSRTLVLCGGAVGGPVPEAHLMQRYARGTLGFTGTIVIDDTSRSTWENIAHAVPHLERADTIKIVSNAPHAEMGREILHRQRPDLAGRLVRGREHLFGEAPVLTILSALRAHASRVTGAWARGSGPLTPLRRPPRP